MMVAAGDANVRNLRVASPGRARVQTARPRWDAEAGIDLAFAAASVSTISGFNLPGIHAPVFVLFVAVTTLVTAKRYLRPRTLHVFPLPLLIFACIHLLFAFRISPSNGMKFVLQAAFVGLFVWALVARYSQVSMRRYLTFTGVGIVGLLVYVIIYHVSHGKLTSYKLLDDPKAIFNLLPLMLLVLHLGKSRSSKLLFSLLLPIFVTIILLSGERKAYILMALVAPFLLNFRSVSTYLAIFIVALAVPFGLTYDKGGYVERQLSTLTALAQGKVQNTASNESRAMAIEFAWRLFEKNPVVGVGTNGSLIALDREFHITLATHNEWVRVAAENGILGLFFYAATAAWGLVGLLRHRVGNRIRSPSEKLIAFYLFATLILYISFEALDFVVILAFCLTPIVQYLRLDPNDDGAAPAPAAAFGRLGAPAGRVRAA